MKMPLNRHETEEAKIEKAISGEAVKNDQILAKESEIASLLRMSRENGNGKS
ncbi:hypothetical protein THOM_2426 [Trachipleistophora hominis]|uniref:Uncharacterized protein n=1 Tax=Trachipleistophora hominis TaxID=72359 RepID=L7JV54_TRAHO|nr:hypothetical protein THOM_2426 [Trachipleistophora hominis]